MRSGKTWVRKGILCIIFDHNSFVISDLCELLEGISDVCGMNGQVATIYPQETCSIFGAVEIDGEQFKTPISLSEDGSWMSNTQVGWLTTSCNPSSSGVQCPGLFWLWHLYILKVQRHMADTLEVTVGE